MGASAQSQTDETIDRLRAAVEAAPHEGQRWIAYIEALIRENRPDEAQQALTQLRQAGAAGPVLDQLEMRIDPINPMQRALDANPNSAGAHNNLGVAFEQVGRLDEAAASYRSALALAPGQAEAHLNLGNVLNKLERVEEAIASFETALAINPRQVSAHSNLGNAQRRLGRTADAEASYRRALAIDPDHVNANANLGTVLRGLGRFDEAVVSLRRTLALTDNNPAVHSNLLFALNTAETEPAELLMAEAVRFGTLATTRAGPPVSPVRRVDPKRLRVGLVSGDLGNHPVGYFVESMLAALAADDSSRIDIAAYLNAARADAATARILEHVETSQRVADLPDATLARQIGDDGIDILIDLSGHTARNRLPLFAHRPAPVQASWLGYFATTGVEQMDYFIADPWVAPPSEQAHFTETLWRLPETLWCLTPPEDDIAVAPLPALANGHVTFGSFGALNKMNDRVVAVWAGVLHAMPHSRLLLKSGGLADDAARQATRDRFARRQIAPDRLILEGPSPRADYLRAYGRVDIVLDTFTYPGGTTSAESLWMGAPVLTRSGERLLARNGASIAHNAGLADWIAGSDDDYVRRAAAHAADLGTLSRLRAGLRERVLASPLFDAPRFARNFEAALWGMWRGDPAP